MDRTPPPREVVRAFDAHGEPVPLDGGRGSSWLVGDLVLKPLDMGEAELAWQAHLLSSLVCDDLRTERFRASLDGRLVVAGWSARERLEGRHEAGRWADIVAVGERLHVALARVPRPSFLARRADRWAVGDRVAWGESSPRPFARVPYLPELLGALRPVRARNSLVHGDLTGNVLFADGAPPAVIDLSPYWRPPAFASAVVLADALVWEGADADVLDVGAHIPALGQFLVRALIYRLVADHLGEEPSVPRALDADRYGAAVAIALRLLARAARRQPGSGS